MILTDNICLEEQWAAIVQPILLAARESHAACYNNRTKREWMQRVCRELDAALPADVLASIDWATNLLWVRQKVDGINRQLILPATEAAEAYYGADLQVNHELATDTPARAPFLDELPPRLDNTQ